MGIDGDRSTHRDDSSGHAGQCIQIVWLISGNLLIFIKMTAKFQSFFFIYNKHSLEKSDL